MSPQQGGSKPVSDAVSERSLLIGLHARMDLQDSDLAEIKRFFKGDNASGNDGAVSRLNAHSKDLGEVKDELTWVRRGVIGSLAVIALAVASWAVSKVADGQHARADTTQTPK